ncbi:GspH/FimT family pseudopilin [Rheinheimera sp. WS51]|uniref:GspH/FimT family pseudopilin n=1 Tax=Rheinheimera sp. WS51 TaxID=3425886 RepID=UPI003D8A7408
MLNKKHKKQQGFTLIEMMVTVAVIAITLAIAVPSFTSLINGNRLTGQANEILAALILARTEAIKQNQVMVLCHSSDATNCSAAPSTGWKGWLVMREGGGIVIANGQINANRITTLASLSLSSASDSIRFTPQGLARTATNGALNGTIRVCMSSVDNNVRDIVLRSGGRAHVNSSSAASCGAPANPS